MKVGDQATVRRVLLTEDITTMARLSQDYNPLHLDEQFGRTSSYGQCIAHGLLAAALVSGALTKLLGPGNLWLEAPRLQFVAPAYSGDVLECRAEVVMVGRRGECEVSATVSNPAGVVVRCEARCLQPHRES